MTILSDCMHIAPRHKELIILLVSEFSLPNLKKIKCNFRLIPNLFLVFGFNAANEAATVTLSGFKSNTNVQSYEVTPETDLYSQ